MSELAQRFARVGAAPVADAQEGRGLLGSGLRRLSGRGAVAGPAITAACEDGSAVAALLAMQQASPGDVLCMEAPGATAHVGDLVMEEVSMRGLAGVVIDGYLRDADDLEPDGVSYWARGATPIATGTRSPGRALVPVTLGPTVVSPGDWIVADGDGAVAVPAADVERVLAAAEAKADLERRVRDRIRTGTPLIQAFEAELESPA